MSYPSYVENYEPPLKFALEYTGKRIRLLEKDHYGQLEEGVSSD